MPAFHFTRHTWTKAWVTHRGPPAPHTTSRSLSQSFTWHQLKRGLGVGADLLKSSRKQGLKIQPIRLFLQLFLSRRPNEEEGSQGSSWFRIPKRLLNPRGIGSSEISPPLPTSLPMATAAKGRDGPCYARGRSFASRQNPFLLLLLTLLHIFSQPPY